MLHLASMTEVYATTERMCQADPSVGFLLRRIKSCDSAIHEHSIRSAHTALLLARAEGMAAAEVQQLYRTALLQDIGKLCIPSDSGLSTKAAFLQHPVIGAQLLAPLAQEGRIDGEALLQHHENLDGTGYPYGLKGDKLTRNAKILRVADAFTMMTFVNGSVRRTVGAEWAVTDMFRWCDTLFEAELLVRLSEIVRHEDNQAEG